MSDEDSGRNEAATVVPFRRRVETPDKAPDTTPAKTPAKLWRDALGEEIHRQRTVRRDRLVDTAGRAGISPQYLSELERGVKDPSSEVLEAVAGALGKSSFELVRSASGPTGPVLLAA